MKQNNYPKNWQQIRQEVQKRDGDFCTSCGIENYAYLKRNGTKVAEATGEDLALLEDIREAKKVNLRRLLKSLQMIWINLQTSHKDHDTTNNNLSNLTTLCQRCHMKYDAKRHAESRKYGTNHRRNQLTIKF